MRRILSVCAILLLCSEAKPQLVVDKQAILFTDSNSLLFVDMELSVNRNGAINNKGSIECRNDIYSNGDFSSGYGSLLFLNGYGQLISGSGNLYADSLYIPDDGKALVSADLKTRRCQLNNATVEINNGNVIITDTSEDALHFKTGRFYTSFNGKLLRKTAPYKTYTYPVSGNGTDRPLVIKTEQNPPEYVEVALVAQSPTAFGLSELNQGTYDIHQQYFYTIKGSDHYHGYKIALLSDSVNENYKSISYWETGKRKWFKSNDGENGLTLTSLNIDNHFSGLDKMINKLHYFSPVEFADHYVLSNSKGSIEKAMRVEIPGGFTPNDDGLNDYLEIKGIERFPDNEITILNSWGEVVYNKSGYNNTNDLFTGKGLMQGSYIYSLTITNSSGEVKRYDGQLTIIR